MTKTEILEFLELPDSATETDIENRLPDKQLYFQRLHDSAPNETLRRLHAKNLEKIKTIEQLYSFKQLHSDDSSFKLSAHQIPAKNNDPIPVAWLIRHTENLPAKNYPLYAGENFIGRHAQPGKNCILIDDDPYMSRSHALLYVEHHINNYAFYITDNAAVNSGRASKNGTYVNGNEQRLTGKTALREGDTIQVGNTKLVLRLNNDPVKNIIHEVEESEYMKTVVINIL